MSIQAQIGTAIGSLLPVKEGVVWSFSKVVELARDLRKSGSDIVVETDLASAFGRMTISSKFEAKFKDVIVKSTNFEPLIDVEEVELHSGPGPTLVNAFTNRAYLATFIQLSLLGWMHNREKIASMLSFAMRQRHKFGIAGSSPDPGYEGIMSTLVACNSQTAAFNWGIYSKAVQEKLKTGIPTFQYSAEYIRMTPSVLLGALETLYAVQSLPEDRQVSVSKETGSITLIIWAHYVLGLTVVVKGKVTGPIIFGTDSKPQVSIEWTKENAFNAGELVYPNEWGYPEPEPEVRLLDPELQVVLKVVQSDEYTETIGADDRHTLQGWGTEYLQRLLNTTILIGKDDPIYEETVKLVTALAINASRRLDRDMSYTTTGLSQPSEPIEPPTTSIKKPSICMSLEKWRIFNAACIIFDGISIDPNSLEKYCETFSRETLTEMTCPATFESFLKRVRKGISGLSPWERLCRQIWFLARIVLILSHIKNIKSCELIPIRLVDYHSTLALQMTQLRRSPNTRATVRAEEIFHGVATLLSTSVFDPREDMPRYSGRTMHFLYLWSDFGWSVYLDTVGDKDPADIRPELVNVEVGTPTNIKTNERKLLLRDGRGYAKKIYPNSYPLFEDVTYVPRCAAKVIKRSQIWTSRVQEFESTIFFSIEPSPEWRKQRDLPRSGKSRLETSPEAASASLECVSAFEEVGGYREMQTRLWQAFLTPNDICTHVISDQVERPVKLGPDAVALLGWSNIEEYSQSEYPQRILIFLTRGDSRIRWLAVLTNIRNANPIGRLREIMLRTLSCCEECALAHVASLPGRWILIL
jgi:hypothetical protein